MNLQQFDQLINECNASYWKITTNAPFDAFDDIRAFALFWSTKEFSHLNKPVNLSTGENVDEFHSRILDWMFARLRWHRYDLLARCPEATNPDPTIARAAFLGWTASGGTNVCDPATAEFLSNPKLSNAARRMFFEVGGRGGKATARRHPEIDSWLICIWPIVANYHWTYHDVYTAAQKKFPNHDDYPLGCYSDLGKHCRGLGMRTVNRRGTAKRTRSSPRPAMFDLALLVGI